MWESACSHESQCISCVNEDWGGGSVIYAYMCMPVYVCVREPVSNPLNHCRVSSMCVCMCVPCLPGGLSLPAVLLCESEVSPLELPSALIWS